MRFVRVTIGKCFETNQMHDFGNQSCDFEITVA